MGSIKYYLLKSAVTKGTYNLQNLRNEWANFKQYTPDEESHVTSLTPNHIKTNFIFGILGFFTQYSIGTYRD